MSKTIVLTRGQVATVDDSDFDYLSQWKWFADVTSKWSGFYAVRMERSDGRKRKKVRMHHEVARLAYLPHSLIYDHRDCDGLNNRRSNIRPASRAANKINSRKQQRPSSSRFKGVSWDSDSGKWKANIRVDNVLFNLGRFHDESQAAAAYMVAAKRYFGEFARQSGAALKTAVKP